MQRIINLIGGRNVAIFCQGPSLYEVEKHAGALCALPVCFASMNKFVPFERHVLQPRDRQFEILFCAAPTRMGEESKHLHAFLKRPYPTLLLTRPSARDNFRNKIGHGDYETIRDRVIPFICERSANRPADAIHLLEAPAWDLLTLGSLSLIMLKAGVERIAVFGCDGGPVEEQGLYYEEGAYEADNIAYSKDKIVEDTQNMSEHWGELCDAADVWSGTFEQPKIINACPHSRLECWPRVSVPEAIAWLNQK